jgi:hypothetical protein
MIRTVRIDLPASLSDDAVTLRPLRVDDAPAYVAAFIDDQELGRLLGVEKDPDEQSIHEEISRQSPRSEEGAGARLVIADPATDAFLGRDHPSLLRVAAPTLRNRLLACSRGPWTRPRDTSHFARYLVGAPGV